MNWKDSLQTETTAHSLKQERLIRDVKPDPSENFFWFILGAHILIWTILTSLTQPNLPAETLDLLTAGQSPAWGYYEHPPLPVWILSIAATLFAPAAWPAYLLAQVCIAICMWSAWKIGRDFLNPWTAICGAVALEGCFFFTIGSATFTSAHLAGALWALAIVALYHGFQLDHRRFWVLLGVCLGLGMLSHYSTALLIIAMIAFSVINHKARQCWDTSWPFLTAAIAFMINLPHIWWAWSNDFSTVSTAMEGWNSAWSHAENTVQFLIPQVLAVIPVLLLLIPIIASVRFDVPIDTEDEEQDFVRQYLLVLTLMPAALMVALALIVGVDLGATGITLWTFMGVLLLLWSDLHEGRVAWRRVILNSGAVGGAFATLLVVMNFMLPFVLKSEQPADIHFPGRSLAREVRTIWKDFGYKQDLAIVAGPEWLAQNASWYHGTFHRPFVYNNLQDSQSAGVNDERLLTEGGVILWTDKDAEKYTPDTLMIQDVAAGQLANVEFIQKPLELAWGRHKDAAPLLVHVAVVHPVQTLPDVETPVGLPEPETEPSDFIPDTGEVLPNFPILPNEVGQTFNTDDGIANR